MITNRTVRSLKNELRRSPPAKAGVLIVLLLVFAATFAPFLAPHDPTQQGDNHLPPAGFTTTGTEATTENGEVVMEEVERSGTLAHPLGTDSLGRDVLSRILYGARTSLLVGVIATSMAAVFGSSFGLVSGYFGGRTDDLMMRVLDVMLSFPSLILAITLVGLFGPASVEIPDPVVWLGLVDGMPETVTIPGTITFVIAVASWVWIARVARGEALGLRDEDYVKFARGAGASNRYLIRKHILPNSLTPIIVLTTIQVAIVILLESTLAFLGFSGTTLSWGFDVAQGRDYLASSWWITTMPGLAILVSVVGINLVGDWLRDALDPGISSAEGGFNV